MRSREALQEAIRGLGSGEIRSMRQVQGGDSYDAWQVETEQASLFLKTGGREALAAFESEADGLAVIGETIWVPNVVGSGPAGGLAWLALDWLPLESATRDSDQQLGTQLAELHRRQGGAFGWHRDNYIGQTPQPNQRSDGWLEFYGRQRLRFQLELAFENGFGASLEELANRLLARLPELLDGHEPTPSLLHGDLWSGNRASVSGHPVVFDPAVHYGDRESDLAMTRLFGGFDESFYLAYESAWPLEAGWERRVDLYQLYHILNHLNLFGAGYLRRARDMMKRLLN